MATYTVKSGDSLGKIAKSLGLSGWQELYNLNKGVIGSNPNLIKPGQVLQVPGTSSSSGSGSGSEGASDATGSKQPEALPRGAKLVRYGNIYKVVWDLGGGLGWAYYDISADHLKKLYGSATPAVDEVYTKDQFFDKYKPAFFGNIAEVSLKAEDPWQDLKDRIFDQFGWVAGIDDPQIKRLLIQAYFEDWSQNQWLVEYRRTDYYQKSTDQQRQWASLSKAEKDQRVREQAAELRSIYSNYWGNTKPATSAINDAAFKIASGQMTLEEWEWKTRSDAEKVPETPAQRRVREEEEAKREEGNQIENMTLLAENEWRRWVGPGDMPTNFASKWGNDLASGKASEADLENYLKSISDSRWQFKPEGATWEDWASSYKATIRSTLELGDLDDNDPLLQKILSSDMSGVDLNSTIRSDERFRSTRTMFGELSSAAEDIGRRFGFIT